MRALLLLALAACGGFDDPCPASLGPSCVVATIHVSGSSNAAPIDVVVHADGSAERTIEPGSSSVPESPMSFAANDANVETVPRRERARIPGFARARLRRADCPAAVSRYCTGGVRSRG